MAKIQTFSKTDGMPEIIQIEATLLLPAAIKELNTLQEYNNDRIVSFCDSLADVMAYFSTRIHLEDDGFGCIQNSEFSYYISEISYIRRTLKNLRKPLP